jgi:hypothetical protein
MALIRVVVAFGKEAMMVRNEPTFFVADWYLLVKDRGANTLPLSGLKSGATMETSPVEFLCRVALKIFEPEAVNIWVANEDLSFMYKFEQR